LEKAIDALNNHKWDDSYNKHKKNLWEQHKKNNEKKSENKSEEKSLEKKGTMTRKYVSVVGNQDIFHLTVTN